MADDVRPSNFPILQLGTPPLPTVLLRHELAVGSHHFDWMFAPEADTDSPLVSFRSQHRLDELVTGQRIELERIGDHRNACLHYEGPVSGNRGVVWRICSGQIMSHSGDIRAGTTNVHIEWQTADGVGREQILQIGPLESARWFACCVTIDR